MITYQWLDKIGPDVDRALFDLVARAAAFDDEMGFSKVALEESSAGAQPFAWSEAKTYHLLARMSHAQVLAAYLRVDVSCVRESATLHFVVGPEFRSLGVATLLFELLQQDTAAGRGWSVTGAAHLQAWAHGNHPAAQRMARRFGAPAAQQLWRLCRPLTGRASAIPRSPEPGGLTVRRLSQREQPLIDEVGDLLASIPNRAASSQQRAEPDSHPEEIFLAIGASGRLVGALGTSEHSSSGPSGTGSIRTLAVRSRQDGGQVERALLEKGIAHLGDRGAHTIDVYVDPTDTRMLRMCRSLGFGHDQTDVCYVWPQTRSASVDTSSTTERRIS